MSEIIHFTLGFVVGTLAYRGWKYLSKARKRDINSRIERGRRTVARMERRPKRTQYPLCDALVGTTDCIEKLNAAFSGRDKNGGPE